MYVYIFLDPPTRKLGTMMCFVYIRGVGGRVGWGVGVVVRVWWEREMVLTLLA